MTTRRFVSGLCLWVFTISISGYAADVMAADPAATPSPPTADPSPQAASPFTTLTFEVTRHTDPSKSGTQTQGTVPPDSHYTMTVVLAGNALDVDDQGIETRYDFAKNRIYRLNKSDKTYEDVSLYTVLGFNTVEFTNRMMLGRVLAAAKLPGNPMAPAYTENLMALSDPNNHTVIDHEAHGDHTTYTWDGSTFAIVSQKVQVVPADALRQYLRFLRYTIGGHPQILAAIGTGGGVPERLTVVRTNMSTETRTLSLQHLEESPAQTLTLDGFTRKPADAEPLRLIEHLPADPTAALEQHLVELRQERDAALAGEHLLDAMLANIAAMLASGDQTDATAWFSAHREQIMKDADATQVTQNLKPHDEKSARAAAETLEQVKKHAGPHGYVLDIFEANTLRSLHEGAKAVDLFIAALSADPLITGAWVDLGTTYYGDFRAVEAWACWDTARMLKPNHPFNADINAGEQKLRTDHPEFF
jgi:hypothetical protein